MNDKTDKYMDKAMHQRKDRAKNNKPKFGKNLPFNPARKKLLNPTKGQIIGITGGIASGKTFVLECLKKLGFEVFNADEAVHKMLQKDGKAFLPISQLVPEAVCETGIDRKILGTQIFGNTEKLRQVEAILHPLVREAQVEFTVNVKKNTGKSMVFEVPLLFENRREQYYDLIIVTSCPLPIQKDRALARNNMTEEKFDAIIKRQMADSLRIKKADFVIKTGRSLEDTMKQVKELMFDATRKRDFPRYRDNRANTKR
jgi:dephospho-CoA kinase